MAKAYTLSAVILSRNACHDIRKCIQSLLGWADEIIVVDGLSNDGTIEFAESRGAKVYSHLFLGSFAEERNFGASKAQGQWILQLDTDEVVTEEFKAACNEVLPATKYVAFKFWRKNTFLGHAFTYGGWYHRSQHLYRKGFARYEGRVHENMIVQGDLGCIDADIEHFPFKNISEFIARQNRYTDLQAKDILDAQEDLSEKLVRFNLTWKPLKLFKKMFLDKKGYKEGIHGFIFSVLFAWVHFVKWAKVWELRRKSGV